ncbi:DUF58 domain-containing protein [Microbacterium sp. zg.Y1090]|uniref:DUF58 domain-containing protein n=1 Tax=Microbacterium TaxID=33882 RepID=UPI00214C3B39|nr:MULTISPECIES: DUF58 domain-containing protein [unclassified Microbacterium]MCR2812734.1 DUF58 domain-containing protein [Microbacterium sp. zg.Y1084]MCR2817472.1 DUF58 domain-containing protein [Microbacterium sp. zg.Y1090]MDL5485886.1 DUF58 domain-containing protein [Microbacterium sp. zg-Y1211]WIM29044.1 DUF58 domain-containing protein [Microbacterium sp. zg-Y1090]
MQRPWPLTIRGTGAVLLGLGCLLLASDQGVPELLYVAVLLLAVVAAALLSLYAVRRADGMTRTVTPEVLTVGGQARVTARVSLRSAMASSPGTWHDTLSPGLGWVRPPAGDAAPDAGGRGGTTVVAGGARGVFPALGSSLRGEPHTVDVDYRIEGTRRGVHTLGPLAVSSTDPFGLVLRSHTLPLVTQVVVAPEVVDLPALSDLPGEAGGTRHTASNELGQGADNLIPRVYVAGDSMRRIHWRASAHRDELMVRQEEQESTPAATVVLDLSTGRFSTDAMRGAGLDPGFERALSACVSVVSRLVREGYTVSVTDADGHPLADPIEGGDLTAVETLGTGFATLITRRDDHLGDLVSRFVGAIGGPLVVIVGRFDAADAATLAPVAHHSSLPVLLSVAPVGEALAHAAEHGWHPAAIGPDDDLAAAWQDAVDRGVGRVLS